VERAVNTTLTCAEIGCTASASLFAFDPATEEAQFCLLSVGLHATDFDGDYSREMVKNWNVNNFIVTSRCEPQAMGCNETAWRPVYPCLTDIPVDVMLQTTGSMNISGTLSEFVDECPYEGNLLSGVAFVTCMVRPLETTTTTTTNLVEEAPPVILVSAPLQCSKPGCIAYQEVKINPIFAMMGGTCTMNVSVLQTDFDQSLDQPELIEYIRLKGVAENISTDVQPGLNPCVSAYQGTPIAEEDKYFSVVENVNVTEAVLNLPVGALVVTGKISKFVDECGSPEGYLLDGVIDVRCEPPATSPATA